MAERLIPARVRAKLEPYQHLMIRLPLGVVFIAHGGQCLFGWWNGAGFIHSIQSYQLLLGIPLALGVLAVFAQFFGGILILIGLLTRPTALVLAALMIAASFKVHLPHGFFLNWEAAPGRGHGVEFNLVLIGMCLMLVLGGPGRWAVDKRGD
jgi:putative oxidoreductase